MEIHRNTSIPQKIGKNSKYTTSYLKELEKEQQIKPTLSRKGEIIKIRAELNEIETRRTVNRLKKPGVGSLKELMRYRNHYPALLKTKEKRLKLVKSRMK